MSDKVITMPTREQNDILEIAKSFVALLVVLDKMADKLIDLSRRVAELEESTVRRS